MQQVTVTFDLIFDLRRHNGSLFRPWCTTFSFTTEGVTRRDLSVPGWPALHVGQTVLALLRKDGDWQSLIGWIDLDTGEVIRPRHEHLQRRALWLALGVGGLVLLLHGVLMFNSGPAQPQLKLLAALLWAAYGLFAAALAVFVAQRTWRRRREQRALEACLRSLEATRPSGRSSGFGQPQRLATGGR